MNEKRYAVVKDGKTVNVIVWDGVTSYTPPEGCELVLEADAPPYEPAPENDDGHA